MELEEWRDIPGLEGYQASSLGRIRSVRVLAKIREKKTGYERVSVHREEGLRKNRKASVHGLVALAFIGPKPLGKGVNHKNSIRDDNAYTNLEYATRKEDIRHSFKAGNRALFFTDEQMDKIADRYFDDGVSMTTIARELTPEPYDELAMISLRGQIRRVIEIWKWDRRRGRNNPYQPKLSLETANQIRDLYSRGDVSQRQLAKMFECSPGTICRVVSGQAWTGNDMRGKHSKGNPNFGKMVNDINRERTIEFLKEQELLT